MKNRKLLLNRLFRLRQRRAGIRPRGLHHLYRYKYRLPTMTGIAADTLAPVPKKPSHSKQ